ncbi:MAG: ABC transporter ATP-binding protein [Nitrospinota bacterium]
MAEVYLEGLEKRFDRTVAVDSLDLRVADREFLILVGPSGCGKTTVLRLIAGLETPTSGRIRIGGTPVEHLPAQKRDIAMVFQNYALYPHMDVYRNMAFGLEQRKVPKGEIRRRVLDATVILGIGDLLDRKPRQLSGGQRQRVALGRAIVRKPSVFLFDEPLSNLDAKLRVKMRAELVRLHRRLDTTIIYVTHDQVEAMTMGQRIAVMNEGRMQQVGPPMDVYRNPANRFIAGFIGSPPMNFIEARLEPGEPKPTVTVEGKRLLRVGVRDSAARGQARQVVLGVRPEGIRVLTAAPAESTPDLLSGRIEVVERLGAETYLEVAVGRHQITARVEGVQSWETGQQVGLRLDPASVRLFDPETEEAISLSEDSYEAASSMPK